MKTLPEISTPAMQAQLEKLDWMIRTRRLKLDGYCKGVYKIFAEALERAGARLTSTDIDVGLPEMVLQTVIDSKWTGYPPPPKIPRPSVIPSPYLPEVSAPYQGPARKPSPKEDEKIGNIPVTASFKVQFLEEWLGGCRADWRLKMGGTAGKNMTSVSKVGAAEGSKPDKSALGRDVDRPRRYADISPRYPAYESAKPWPALPPDLGEPVGGQNEHAEVGSEPISREERLQAFIVAHPGTTLADIKYSARVHTPEFQDWRNDRLKQQSLMSQRIEDVLSGAIQLKKKPPKTHKD